ncbi:MAG: hypothetical protein U1F71_23650 [Verrucomicrobiaceae bacterium]
MNNLLRLGIIAFLVCGWLPSPAAARPPVSTPLTGTIRSVDAASRKVTFIQDGGSVREFVWVKWAKFWHSTTSCTTPAHLKPGMRVQISFQNPLFGPDYVTRIDLLAPHLRP